MWCGVALYGKGALGNVYGTGNETADTNRRDQEVVITSHMRETGIKKSDDVEEHCVVWPFAFFFVLNKSRLAFLMLTPPMMPSRRRF